MIIQTGQRTDIPAFYSKWFMKRLKEGFVLVRNPYNPSSVTRYDLRPDVVDLLAFCTKNPAPMLPYLDELKAYGQYWFVTITPYGRDIEPNVPEKEKVMADFVKLSRAVGVDSVGWRYDPILLTEKYTVERHIKDFEYMARTLSGCTKTCVISFIDLYEKVKRNFPEIKPVSRQERMYLGKAMIEIAGQYGMTIKPCGEGDELEPFGADCRGCTTLETFETAMKEKLDAPKYKPLRKECGCYLGQDIGAYNTCGHFCRYCYANANGALVKQNMTLHDPDSPFLIGGNHPGDEIHQSKQESWIRDQLMIDF